MVTDPAGLGEQLLERGDFGLELVEFDRGGELVRQPVAVSVVQVVFVLLGVGHAPLQLGQTTISLRRGKLLQFVQQLLLAFQPAADRFIDCQRGTGQSPLEHGAGQGDTGTAAASSLMGKKLIYVGGDGLVEVVFLLIEVEGDGVGVAVGEEPAAVKVAEVFLQSP